MAETRKLAAMVIVICTAVVYWVFRGKLRHM
jgi:dipeptide/tripeptide permease